MICIRIRGGLGNQLFQYASSFALAKRLNQKLHIDTSFYPEQTLRAFKLAYLKLDKDVENNSIKLPYLVNLVKNRYVNRTLRFLPRCTINIPKFGEYILETQSGVVGHMFEACAPNVYLDGYFQSERYFIDCREDLLRQLTPNYRISDKYLILEEEVKNCTSVAFHVRRGDFLQAQNSNPWHYLLGAEYYKNALGYVNGKLSNPINFWFSDDIEWVKKTFGIRENFRFVNLDTKNADIDEMMLMKSCKHIISANSSFSWWAAWLNQNNNKLVVVPNKRYGNTEMIPASWVKLATE